MYAVVKTGGKQYRVAEGDTVRVEKLAALEGAVVELGQVLMIVDGDQVTVGSLFVVGGTIKARVNRHGRDDKVKIVKFRRRKHYLKRQGHRQWYTELNVIGISVG